MENESIVFINILEEMNFLYNEFKILYNMNFI